MARVHYSHASRPQNGAFFGFAAGVVRRFRERRQMIALLKMDDYMLKDIGVSLGDIQSEASKSIWRD